MGVTLYELIASGAEIFAASVVGVLASARMVILITLDDWPPMNWVRIKWGEITDEGPWYKLVECPWCIAPWIVAPNLALAALTDLHLAWWVLNVWFAASLATSWVAIKAGD